MRILAIDTSCSVSVLCLHDGSRVLASDAQSSENRHAETLLPRIEALLTGAGLTLGDLELIAVGVGPGSFTGLRVGLATAKGLALATGLPLRGVHGLQAMARGLLDQAPVAVVAIDAGRGEVFGGVYASGASGALRVLLAPRLATPELFVAALAALALDAAAVGGAGARRYWSVFAPALPPGVQLAAPESDVPQGHHVALEALTALGQNGPSSVAELEPLYMRASDAKLPERPLSLE